MDGLKYTITFELILNIFHTEGFFNLNFAFFQCSKTQLMPLKSTFDKFQQVKLKI